MKLLTLAAAAALPTMSLAWEFTWHSADGEAHIESGKGASECIKVNHAKGEVFRIDAKGEKFIDMRLYDTDDCEGDPSGQASKFFTKESSIAIKGFQVVQLNETGASDDDKEDEKEDDKEDDKDDEDSFSLPTVSSTPTPTATSSTDGGAKPTGASGSATPSPTPSGSFAAPAVGGNMGRVAGAVGVACVIAGLFGY